MTPATRPVRRLVVERAEPSPRTSIRVVVGGNDPLYRAGITAALRHAGAEVVGSADNARDLERKTRGHHPDVAIVDLDMAPGLVGEERVQAACSLRSIDPRMAIVILSQVAQERDALAILGDQPAGFGYLVKTRIRDIEDFTAAVRRVARGGTAIDPYVVSLLAGRRPSNDPLDTLSAREREVLAAMAEGRSNRSIAGELVVTVPAVERHITRIFAKLGLSADVADHRRVLAVLRYLGR
jgi:DNA-binding NarL/FixJ family response regulator